MSQRVDALFVPDAAAARTLAEASGEFFALTVDAAVELETLGHDPVRLWSRLAFAELEAIHDETEKLLDTWFEGPPRGLDRLAWTPALDREAQKWHLRDGLYVRHVLDGLISEGGFARLVVPGPLERPGVYYGVSDTVSAVAARAAELRGLPIKILDRLPARSARRRLLRGAAAGLRRRNMRRGAVNASTGLRRIGVATHGLAFADELVMLLVDAGWTPILFDLNALDAGTLRGPPRAFPSWATGDAAAAWPELFANPYLDFHERHYRLERWPRLEARRESIRAAVEVAGLDVLLVSNLNDAENWLLAETARNARVPVAVALHSGWPDPSTLFPLADRVLVWAESLVAPAKAVGAREVRVVGALGLEHLASQPVEWDPNAPHVVVVSAAATAGLTPVLDVDNHVGALRAVLSVPRSLRGCVRVTVKCKPDFDHPALYRSLAGTGVEILEDTSLAEVLDDAAVAVLVNVPTTGYHEAVVRGIPVVFVETTPVRYCGQPRLPDGAVRRVHEPEEVWPVIASLLDPSRRAAEIARQRERSAADLGLGTSAQRVVSALGELLT